MVEGYCEKLGMVGKCSFYCVVGKIESSLNYSMLFEFYGELFIKF